MKSFLISMFQSLTARIEYDILIFVHLNMTTACDLACEQQSLGLKNPKDWMNSLTVAGQHRTSDQHRAPVSPESGISLLPTHPGE
jgi:hypothetical protein